MEVAWFILVLSFLLIYITTDGYDLGVGILTLFERDKATRYQEVSLVANVWDGNETWLVMTGVALWGGFPLIYGSVLQFMYPVVFTMLFGLILRGFSTEMIRSRGVNAPKKWYRLFGLGSLVAATMQGVALGSLTSKITIVNHTNASIPGSFLSWYSILFGILVISAYVTLGYAYLNFHQINPLKTGHRGLIATISTTILLVVAVIAVNFTPAPLNLSEPWRISAFISLSIVTVIFVGLAAYNFINTKQNFYAQAYPMIGIIMATIVTAIIFTVTHFPNIVPGGVDAQTIASADSTYRFLLVGVGLWIPLMWYFVYFVHHSLLKRGNNGVWSLIPGGEDDE